MVQGQIHPETAFYWENPYYLSPAYVNLDYKGYFSLAARKQWAGLDGSPATFLLPVHCFGKIIVRRRE